MLLAAFQAARGVTSIERPVANPRPEVLSRTWQDILTRISPVEAALLQDFDWWSPLMEERLQHLSNDPFLDPE